ncbi:MAG: GNAT family N-acetyltransferase [Candidatus Accumulibacter sp. UW26]|jgi:acetyltransferase
MKQIFDRWQAKDGSWLAMRRMHPSDAPLLKDSLNQLSASARRNRFFASIAEFSDAAVQQLVDVDPEKTYPLVVLRTVDGMPVPIAGGRLIEEDDGSSCSFSLLVGDDWQGLGIGRRILKALLREAARRRLRQMYGHVLSDNQPMLRLARSLRFVVLNSDEGGDVLTVVHDLPVASRGRRRGFFGSLFRK